MYRKLLEVIYPADLNEGSCKGRTVNGTVYLSLKLACLCKLTSCLIYIVQRLPAQ